MKRWLLLLGLWSPYERVVAAIDGTPVTSVELGRYQALFLPEASPEHALDPLIRLLLLERLAQRYQIEPSPEQVAAIRRHLDPDGRIRRRWAMNEEDLTRWAQRQARVDSLLQLRATPGQGRPRQAEIDDLVQDLARRWRVERTP